jgi:hypothetical protein
MSRRQSSQVPTSGETSTNSCSVAQLSRISKASSPSGSKSAVLISSMCASGGGYRRKHSTNSSSRGRRTLSFNGHTRGGIQDKAPHPDTQSKIVDKGPEADALYDSPQTDSPPLDRGVGECRHLKVPTTPAQRRRMRDSRSSMRFGKGAQQYGIYCMSLKPSIQSSLIQSS